MALAVATDGVVGATGSGGAATGEGADEGACVAATGIGLSAGAPSVMRQPTAPPIATAVIASTAKIVRRREVRACITIDGSVASGVRIGGSDSKTELAYGVTSGSGIGGAGRGGAVRGGGAVR